jgi:outer membrane protein OmpA-like peptidoglycan-associated protein
MLLTLGSPAAFAQQETFTPTNAIPKYDIAVGYNYIRANAPPAGCDCFGMNGGFLSAGFRVNDWLGFAADATGGHSDNIGSLGQNLNLFTLTTGPRISYHYRRLVPYGQAMLGLAHGSDSYFPTATSYSTSASTYAFSAGGGLDYNLTHRYAIRAINAEFLKTGFQNGSTNTQNHIMLGAGIVIKFGTPHPPPPPPREVWRPAEISFTCSTDVGSIVQGQPLKIIGIALTRPDQLDLDFAWHSTAGTLSGSGREVSLNTTAMAPGAYMVKGRASLVSSPSTFVDCETPFHVLPVPVPPVAPPPPPMPSPANPDADLARQDREFHDNVRDAHFDYDSAVIRPDAKLAIEDAGRYLKAHPTIRVQVQGFADERGTSTYNLELGAERANAARNALMAEGIDAVRIEILSFGKEAQICTENTEACYQQNRRAAFSMHR